MRRPGRGEASDWAGAHSPSSYAYMARQPIVDRDRQVVGYELLFRDTPAALAAVVDGAGTNATARLLANSVIVDGLASVVGNLRGWVNLTESLLEDGVAELLSPSQFVLEVLESVRALPEVLDHCRKLRAAGFTVALDDVVSVDRPRAFPGCFDVVKVDWQAATATELPLIVAEGRRTGATLLAEKVETEADLKRALSLGFSLFQGYAIGLPFRLQRRNITSVSAHSVRLLEVVNAEGFDYTDAEAVVQADPALTFKILAFANSALAAQRTPVNSLRQALVLFGERNLRHAALLIFLAQTAGGTPSFALIEALVGGLFCESLARAAQRADIANTCMLAATLSHMDRLLGISMDELLRRLPVDAVLQEALVSRGGAVGRYVQVTRAFQDGDWTATDALARNLGLSVERLQPLYHQAVVSAERLIGGKERDLSGRTSENTYNNRSVAALPRPQRLG